ncbi:MAG: gamma-glutamylcyclotransferase family protein [Pseudomonadota bacterium]
MTHTAFFGYGSLVNVATHTYAKPSAARLHGWRRIWRGTHLRKVAYLSVHPADGQQIDGLVAQVPGADWAALDQREAAYSRQTVTCHLHPTKQPISTAIYQVDPAHIVTGGTHPILQSYLDTVVQGYLRMFGEAGAQDFFDTTDGWDAPLLNDRASPIYPRAQPLTQAETALVDRMYLAAVMEQAE